MIELKEIKKISFYNNTVETGFQIHTSNSVKLLVKLHGLYFLCTSYNLKSHNMDGLDFDTGDGSSDIVLSSESLISLLTTIEDYFGDSIDNISFGKFVYPTKGWKGMRQS